MNSKNKLLSVFICATFFFLTAQSSLSREYAFFNFNKKKNVKVEDTNSEKSDKLFSEKQNNSNLNDSDSIDSEFNSISTADKVDETYRLGSGDKVRLTVFGEEDLSGEFEVDGSGSVSLPLIGTVKAVGLSTRELEKIASDKLSDGYLIDPSVSIEVLNFRPFFILGEVNEAGSYPYVNGMTVLNAVALAGGFTHRANRDKFLIKRGDDDSEEFKSNVNTKVFPGDLIKIQERFF